jgi:hypothetical protein
MESASPLNSRLRPTEDGHMAGVLLTTAIGTVVLAGVALCAIWVYRRG